MNTLLEKFRKFMIGRYGMDDLGRTMMNVLMGLILISFFVRFHFLRLIIWLGIFYMFYRMFSKDVSARYQENQKFLNWKQNRINRTSSPDKIYQCPKCGQKVRVPKGKGKIAIRCPKCNHEFVKRT